LLNTRLRVIGAFEQISSTFGAGVVLT